MEGEEPMKRVLLKLSGEALAGDKKTGFDEPTVLGVAEQVKKLLASYPADSPVIETIKASPEYKQVAYLIEETPAVNPKYPLS